MSDERAALAARLEAEARGRARARMMGDGEPDELHVAYEIELARLRVENDAAWRVLVAFRASRARGMHWARGEVAAGLHAFDRLMRRLHASRE